MFTWILSVFGCEYSMCLLDCVIFSVFQVLSVLIDLLSICSTIIESSVLRSPNIIVELLISPFKFVIVHFIYFGACCFVCTVDLYATQVWTAWIHNICRFFFSKYTVNPLYPQVSHLWIQLNTKSGIPQTMYFVLLIGHTFLILCMPCDFFSWKLDIWIL